MQCTEPESRIVSIYVLPGQILSAPSVKTSRYPKLNDTWHLFVAWDGTAALWKSITCSLQQENEMCSRRCRWLTESLTGGQMDEMTPLQIRKLFSKNISIACWRVPSNVFETIVCKMWKYEFVKKKKKMLLVIDLLFSNRAQISGNWAKKGKHLSPN